ncbi:TrbI/VirB10 family protein [Candidatus Palauibacter soopunensis]|uniref:TrbI/VirB10 family protein n=1 Tax=Candidatus Palauibacter soopunensis TaxID=3056739 RepID=UPI00239565EE|nr:TrbI/VirB10 family protein [Candidatus Palauibacter soopunensis]MDE2878591.1 TrbI/VirB10 family protein [Candidatus Palauibacter soopunensis]
MSRWKQWVKEPKGALPGGLVTKAGIVLIAVLVAGLLFSSSLAGPGEDEAAAGAPAQPRAVNDREGRSFEEGIRDETERETQRAAARNRAAPPDRDAGAPSGAGSVGAGSAGTDAGGGSRAPGMGRAEFELREALRLEEVERRTRSLRSLPVAQSHRDPNGSPDAAAASSLPPESPDAALDGALASLGQSLAALEAEMAAGLAAGEFAPGVPTPPGRTSTPEPSRLVRPDDPAGWERIHEGTFLEAVLVTQLSGEFPGPVLAMVSAPLYSADRQRVLIPRGARVVGMARAVETQDQSRLAVAFHRLLLPGGSWVDLEFTGLNQVGESALKDQVNRRYLSTFAAAGAVGALSGLTLAGASPYGLRAGVGQGLGGSATSMLDRYLNRMPEITIRAGHRLRVWLTSDVLVPTPPTDR